MAVKNILCPYCFEEFKNYEALHQCQNDDRDKCPRTHRKSYDEYWGGSDLDLRYVWPQDGGFKAKLFGPNLEKDAKCPQCGGKSARYVCPHCFNWLERSMIEEGAEIISVIGSPSSGKTNYIVSLIRELSAHGWKLDLMPHPSQNKRDGAAQESTQEIYKEYQDQLFKEKQVLDKTRVTNKDMPWIFKLEQQNPKRYIYLVFYDSAGEKFQRNLQNNVKYLKSSAGVIILLDTLSIEYIENILKDKGVEDRGGKTEDDIRDMMTSIVGADDESIFKKPVAFVFSKFDAVLDNSEALGFSAMEFMRGDKRLNSSYIETGEVDLEKIDDISYMIEKAMVNPEAWNQGPIWKFAQNWASKKNNPLPLDKQNHYDPDNNYKFFGVSALGHMPEEDNSLGKVEPYRVMDPLIWVLHKLGKFRIPTKKR